MEWNEKLIIQIYKKDMSCNNYSAITLLNVDYKMLTSLIPKKELEPYIETAIGDHQYGFHVFRVLLIFF